MFIKGIEMSSWNVNEQTTYWEVFDYISLMFDENGVVWNNYVDSIKESRNTLTITSKLITLNNYVEKKRDEISKIINRRLLIYAESVLEESNTENKKLIHSFLNAKIEQRDHISMRPQRNLKMVPIYMLTEFRKEDLTTTILELDLLISIFKYGLETVSFAASIELYDDFKNLDSDEITSLSTMQNTFSHWQMHCFSLDGLIEELIENGYSGINYWRGSRSHNAEKINDRSKPGVKPDPNYSQSVIIEEVSKITGNEIYIWDTELKKGKYKKAEIARYLLDEVFNEVPPSEQMTESGMILRVDAALKKLRKE